MGMMYIKTPSQVYGPISHTEFIYLVNSGRIRPTDHILSEFRAQWNPIERFPSLAAAFNGNQYKIPRIIAVGGNKGGVGKTMFASSLALALAKQGKRVLAIDTDFSDPDLNEWLGIKRPSKTLGHFFKKRIDQLEDLIVATKYANLSVIPGEARSLDDTNPRYYQRSKLANQLQALKFDFIILDQSPGVTYSSVDFFLQADEKIIVTIPEPSAILSTFRFIRIALLRRLKSVMRLKPEILRMIGSYEFPIWHHSYSPLSILLDKIKAIDHRAGCLFEAVTNTIQPQIVLNMVMNKKEIEEGHLFIRVLKELLSVKPEFLGTIPYLDDLREMSKERKPLKIISIRQNFTVVDKAYKSRMHQRPPLRLWPKIHKNNRPTSKSVVQSVFANMITNWPQQSRI